MFLGETKMLGKFLKDAASLFELYHYEDDNDWVHAEVGGDQENVDNIRIVRTVYLMSKIAAFHAGKLCSLSCTFPDLWKKIEKAAEDGRNDGPDLLPSGEVGQVLEHTGTEGLLPDLGSVSNVLDA